MASRRAGEDKMTPLRPGKGDGKVGWQGQFIQRAGVAVETTGAVYGDDERVRG